MSRLLRSLSLVAAIAFAGLLPATGSAATATPVVPNSTYVSDVSHAAGALTTYGNILQKYPTPDGIKGHRKAIRTALRTFDQRIYVMSRYRLADPVPNRQRARISASGSRLGPTLTDFIDAILLGDASETNRLAAVIKRQIAAFDAAAQIR